MTHRPKPVARGAVRAGLVAAAMAVFAIVSLASSAAFADVPVGSGWTPAAHVSGFKFLLVLFLIPAGIAIVIAVLASLPSIVSGDRQKSGEAWRNESLWFGGPRKGVEAAESVTPAQLEAAGDDRGGASARW